MAIKYTIILHSKALLNTYTTWDFLNETNQPATPETLKKYLSLFYVCVPVPKRKIILPDSKCKKLTQNDITCFKISCIERNETF
jgi:hypothetical protein